MGTILHVLLINNSGTITNTGYRPEIIRFPEVLLEIINELSKR